MVTLDATVFPDEAYVLVQADWSNTQIRDTFTRTLAAQWGVADTGQAWTNSGGLAADFFVNGSAGVHQPDTIDVSRVSRISGTTVDFDFTVLITFTTIASGGGINIAGALGRVTSPTQFYSADIQFSDGNQVSIILRRDDLPAHTDLDTFALDFNGTAGTQVMVRFQGVGSELRARAWQPSTPQPTVWQVNATDATYAASMDLGARTRIAGGVAGPTVEIWYDNFVAVTPGTVCPSCATISRTNTVTGETVTLRPYISYDADGNMLLECCEGLWWDTEPPLNVPLEYCLVACDTDVALSLNPSFDGSTAAWTATGGVLTQDCTVAKEGLCSGRLTPTGTALNPSVSQTLLTLPATGTPVTTSVWAQSPQGWNTVLLRTVFTYTDLTVDTVDSDWVTLDDNEWRFLSTEHTPSKPLSSVTISFIAAGIPPNTTLFRVDDFKLTQPQATTATACETVTVESDSVWLKNPLHPCLDVQVGLCSPMLEDCDAGDRVSYVGMDADEYEANTVLMTPVNRRYSIPVNRIRRAPANTVRVLAHTCEARDAVLALNEPGDPVLFQAPEDYCIPDRYMSVATLTDSRISVDQREDFRLISLPHVAVERPVGPADGVCGARFMDLCDIYTSWAALNIAGLTYTDLLLGDASPNGPGQPEPPEGARTWGDVLAEFTDWADVLDGGSRDWQELRDGA